MVWNIAEHLKPVNVKIAQLREALAAVSEEQIYLRARDLRHRTSELVPCSPSLVLLMYMLTVSSWFENAPISSYLVLQD